MSGRNLAARARTAITFLQMAHIQLRRSDGEPHPPPDECTCGHAEAVQVIVDLLQHAQRGGTVLPQVPTRYDRSYASPEEKQTGELLQAAVGDLGGDETMEDGDER